MGKPRLMKGKPNVMQGEEVRIGQREKIQDGHSLAIHTAMMLLAIKDTKVSLEAQRDVVVTKVGILRLIAHRP
ncbi:hypothetical protein NDU88_004989 [Pleurodeles waltl]|uniref:Uncharacterized protein n=1 Tax=Pleurodeles waltl TaxID=8319 RepID=A0AAV7TST4_PLEWA|nr:hypothetical protein NDU88_004989 [Pleurodeles waltl]